MRGAGAGLFQECGLTRMNLTGGLIEHVAPWGGAEEVLQGRGAAVQIQTLSFAAYQISAPQSCCTSHLVPSRRNSTCLCRMFSEAPEGEGVLPSQFGLCGLRGFLPAQLSGDSVTPHDPGVAAQEEFLACASATLNHH